MSLIHCNLRVLMAERGLNIQNVKDKTTLSRTTISNLYNNYGSGIKYDTLLELCELLDCTPGDLLSYIEMDTKFDVIKIKEPYEQIQDTHVVNEEGDGYDYISEIQIDLDMSCSLRYEGEDYDLKFKSYVQYHINGKKEMDGIDIALPSSLHMELKKILIPHAKEYFLDEISEFLISWGHDEFYGDEIEGVGSISINFGFLEEEQED